MSKAHCSATALQPGPGWASSAVVHIHSMAAWWWEIRGQPRRGRVRVIGNVVFMPAPVAGYRIRHHSQGASVEIKPRRARAIEVCRLPSAVAARAALRLIISDHARPFLGEVGEAAA